MSQDVGKLRFHCICKKRKKKDHFHPRVCIHVNRHDIDRSHDSMKILYKNISHVQLIIHLHHLVQYLIAGIEIGKFKLVAQTRFLIKMSICLTKL